MRTSLVLVAVVSASAPASAFTLEQVMSAPFCTGLVAAARAPRIAWTVNLRGERNVWAAEAPAWRGNIDRSDACHVDRCRIGDNLRSLGRHESLHV